jgi:hypothetical protein
MIADLRKNMTRELTNIGFPDPNQHRNTWHNRNLSESNLPFLQASLAAGLYPNVASRRRGDINFKTLIVKQNSKIHVSSVNAMHGQPLSKESKVGRQEFEYLVYGELVRGVSRFTMSQTSHIATPLPFLLLCGDFRIRPAKIGGSVEDSTSVMSVDNWIKYTCNKMDASAISILRRRLNVVFLKIVANPTEGFHNLSEYERYSLDALSHVMKASFLASPPRRWP